MYLAHIQRVYVLQFSIFNKQYLGFPVHVQSRYTFRKFPAVEQVLHKAGHTYIM